MSHPYHIVIAEASDAVRDLLVRAIGRMYPNAMFSAVADGIAAQQIIMQRGADLLIVSSGLPQLDAPDLIRAVRGQQRSLPILLLSSHPDLARLTAQLGADQFLLKPFTLPELRQALQSLLP